MGSAKIPYPAEAVMPIADALKHYNRPVFLFCDATGVRINEALNLAVGHIIDANGNYLKAPMLRVSKGGFERRIHITDRVREILDERKAAYGGGWGPPELAVFRNKKGVPLGVNPCASAMVREREVRRKIVAMIAEKPHRGERRSRRRAGVTTTLFGIDYDSDYRLDFRKALVAAGLEASEKGEATYGTHSSRKRYVDRLLEAGTPIETVRDLVGHADIDTTMMYKRQTPPEKALKILEAVDRLEKEMVKLPEPGPPKVKSAAEILGLESPGPTKDEDPFEWCA